MAQLRASPAGFGGIEPGHHRDLRACPASVDGGAGKPDCLPWLLQIDGVETQQPQRLVHLNTLAVWMEHVTWQVVWAEARQQPEQFPRCGIGPVDARQPDPPSLAAVSVAPSPSAVRSSILSSARIR